MKAAAMLALSLMASTGVAAEESNGRGVCSSGACSEEAADVSALLQAHKSSALQAQSQADKIIGGKIADATKYPSYVGFRVFDSWLPAPYTGMEVSNCGSTLIAPRWVMTARHCRAAFDRNQSYGPGYKIQSAFQVGVNLDNDGNFSAKIDIVDSVVFPDPRFASDKRPVPGVDYEGGFKPYVDVALVRLAEDATKYGAKVAPLYRGPKPLGHLVTSVGLGSCPGDDDEYCLTGRVSLRLREVSFPIVPDENCETKKSKWGVFNGTYSFCAGCEDKITKTGSGDSGGPCFIFNEANNRTESIGVVNGGVPIHDDQSQNNFTRFAYVDGAFDDLGLFDWITKTVEENP